MSLLTQLAAQGNKATLANLMFVHRETNHVLFYVYMYVYLKCSYSRTVNLNYVKFKSPLRDMGGSWVETALPKQTDLPISAQVTGRKITGEGGWVPSTSF